ncbi:MAG: DUF5110 domain-containing protein, partial [Muribaculaceae bacterium]|nr:DUF5110 domain-containing protein [Muribaculaceae bacterium]
AYNDFITELNPNAGQTPLFDLSDRRYMDIFFRHSHLPHEKMGVDFWWLDWQQNYLYPYVRGTNTTTLSWINHLYFTRLERDGRRGQGYSRWAGWGDHRYPIQFSGDAQANWPMLAFEVKLSALSGNAGCYFWAHDIGGFRGAPNQELSVRWTQFGAFSAALRVHSTKDAKLDRRPWLSDKRHTNAMRRMYHMRAEMMPYVYSSVWQVHSTMIPLNRPMFIDYGHIKNSFNQHQQFMFGDIILAAPITSPGKGKDLTAEQTVWFPDGDTWYDFFTHERKQGGQTLTISKPLEEFPLYQKAGYILPMQPYNERPASQPLTTLVMRVYPTDSDVEANSYTLYEDDGISTGYKEGKNATTLLTYSRRGNDQKVTIAPTQGSYDGQPLQRAYRLQLPAIDKINSVKVNGRKAKATYDKTLRCHIVEIPAADIRKATTIEYN